MISQAVPSPNHHSLLNERTDPDGGDPLLIAGYR